MFIIAAETVLGFFRELFLAPAIGALPARQIGVAAGCVMILAISLLTIRWLGAADRRRLLMIGVFWVALTAVFEISLGLAIDDYNPARGGLMLFGLAFMGIAPLLAARMRR